MRFSPAEAVDRRRIGIDFDEARTAQDVERGLEHRARTLSNERPERLERIAKALALARRLP